MTNYEKRLQRVNEALIYRMAAEAGEPLGVSPEEVLDEATELLTWPPALLERELSTLQEKDDEAL